MIPLLAFYLGIALLLGVRHALDPDHLVTVSTLVADESRLWPVARLGLVWGAGHLLPIAAIGLPVVWLGLHLPPAFETAVDLGVGLLLIVLGFQTLLRWHRSGLHAHSHTHGSATHAHFHTHGPARRTHAHPERGRRSWVTLLYGIVHGLAGTGPAAVLAASAAPTLEASVGYLLLFGLGTCLGMFLVTLLVAAPALTALSRRRRLHAAVQFAAGLASLGFGMLMSWQRLSDLLLH